MSIATVARRLSRGQSNSVRIAIRVRPLDPLADIIIIGAGIIGSACAWRLALAGLKVVVFDPAEPGSQASQAALGVLSFHARAENPPGLHALASASRQLYPAILEELAEATGERVTYNQSSHLSAALSADDEQELVDGAALNEQHGFAFERVDSVGCRELEPALNPEIRRGLLYLEDAWVDNQSLTQAIVRAARSAGVEFRKAAVEAVEARAERVQGVRAGGELHQAEWVILAAGCWSGAIQGIPPLAVEPRRGQAFAVATPLIRRIVSTRRVYLVPRSNGETLVGATVERVGFEASNTEDGLEQIMSGARELVPGLTGSRIARAWAGLRPGTADRLPAIGPFAALPNLIAATGHFRDGILLAPLTAELVRQLITGEAPSLDLAPFLPDRLALRG